MKTKTTLFCKIINKKNVFILIVLLSFCYSLCMAFYTNGRTLIYYLHPDTLDSYMDLFNSINGTASLSGLDIYPPCAVIPYRILHELIPDEYFTKYSVFRENSFAIRNSVYGQFILILHMICFIITFIFMFKEKMQQSLVKTTILSNRLLISTIFLSGPFLYTFERGNIILYAFLFSFLFFLWYDSESKVKREIAYISIALAANIKLYPAIFVLILLTERKYKETLRCFIYGVLLFFLPMFFFEGGLTNTITFINHLFNFANTNHNSSTQIVTVMSDNYSLKSANGLNTSISNWCYAFQFILHRLLPNSKLAYFTPLGKIVTIVYLSWGLVSCFIVKKQWQKWLTLSLLCVFIPGVSYVYVIIFVSIPLIAYMISDDSSLVPSFLFGGVFSFLTIYTSHNLGGNYKFTDGFIITEFCLFLLALYLIIESIKVIKGNLIFKKSEHKDN